MANDILKRLVNIENKLDSHFADYALLKADCETRRGKHEENARIMKEFAEDYNKLYTEHALNKAAIDQFSSAIKELRTDFKLEVKEFKEEIRNEIARFTSDLKQIAKDFTINTAKETTIKWVIKVAIQALVSGVAITGGIIGIIKYFG